nr:MAG TPA: hypothetical protein [Caudoviricetes sp.]
MTITFSLIYYCNHVVFPRIDKELGYKPHKVDTDSHSIDAVFLLH